MDRSNINILQQKTQQNYQVAQRYYEQKKDMFIRLQAGNKNKQYQKNIQQFYTELLPQFMEQFSKFEDKILSDVSANKNITNFSGFVVNINGINHKISTGLTKQDFLNKDYTTIKREFGFVFEKSLTNFFETYRKNISSNVDNFIAEHTGEIVQEGLTFSGGARAVRSDFVMRTKGKKAKNQTLELQTQLQAFEDPNLSYQEQVAAVFQELKKTYLNKKQFIGGFSVKNYDDNIGYTSSVKLQREFNEYLEQQKIYGKDSAEEAYAHMKYFLSKYVIAISSPSVIALITNKQFLWMHQMLQRYNYIFHLRYNNNNSQYFVNNSQIFLEKQRGLNSFIISEWNNDTMIGKIINPIQFNANIKML